MMKGKFLLPLLFIMVLGGCAPLIFFGAGTAAGVGGFKYMQGKMTVTYQAPLTRTWDATLKAVENMGMKILKQNHDLTSGYIEAKRADGTPVILSLNYKSAEETEVDIRVGVFGDEAASIAIKEEIRKALFKE